MQQAFESLYEQAEKSLSAIDFDKYDEILFVAKSVGTIIASAYAEKHSIRCRQQVPMYIYENANHSLETTDTLENLKILQDVMGKTKGFLERK